MIDCFTFHIIMYNTGLATRAPTEHARRRICTLFAASSRLSSLAPRFTDPLYIALYRNDTWAAFGERALSAIASFYSCFTSNER